MREGVTVYGAPSSLRRHRERIGVAAVVQALAVLLVLAYFAPLAQAAERDYRPVKITDRIATFAIDNLAGRTVVSARLTFSRGRGRRIAPAVVHRAAVGAGAQLRVSLPRSWRPAVERRSISA